MNNKISHPRTPGGLTPPLENSTGSRIAAPVEERFWLLHELNHESPVCNEGTILWFDTALDALRLCRAVEDVAAGQSLIHTGYHRADGRLIAEEHAPSLKVGREVVDAPTHAEFRKLVTDRARTLTAQRFQLDHPPLMRVHLLSSEHYGHALICVFHHIIADGTSFLRIFPQQVAQCYAGEAGPLAAETAAAYECFVDQSHHQEQSAHATTDLQFWKDHLSDISLVVELPTDHAYPQRPSMKGGRIDRVLPANTRQQVARTAEAIGVRPFDVTCGAFVALLLRYSGQQQLVLGTPVANRRGDDSFQHTVGCFIDNLVLKLSFDEAPSFATIARAVMEERRLVRDHQSLSFGTLIDHFQANHNASRPPLYQVMFNYLNFSLSDVSFEGVESSGSRVATDTSMLDLSLDVTEEDDAYRVCLEYNGDVFDRPHAKRMLDHYIALLDDACTKPDTLLGELDVVSQEEKQTIAALSRGPAVDFDRTTIFHETVAERSAEWRDRVAVLSNDTQLTYRDLLLRARQLARIIIDQGVRPTDYVAIMPLPDPCDTVTAIFAVWYAGAAFVSLDTANPQARISTILEDSEASLLIGSAAQLAKLPARDIPCLALDDVNLTLEPVDLDVPTIQGEHPAYLIYTSGSTGTPKGVVVTHQNLSNQMVARLACYDEVPQISLAPYSFAFDAFIGTMSFVLATGGIWRLLDEEQRRDPIVIREIIEQEEITLLDTVPSMYAALLENLDVGKASSLRCIIVGGEALPASLAELHWRHLPSAQLFNEYGPTEGTVFATIHELKQERIDRITPIGKPISNYECWILDSFGTIAPLGHAGELCIAGAGVAAGYHRRTELTAERFVTKRLDTDQEVRLYRTGDEARFREDGLIEFIGRNDEQVQIRGYRVELGEVQAMIEAIPGVDTAVAVMREDVPGQPRLVAYIVADPNAQRSPVDSDVVKTRLKQDVPSYMVPAAIVVLDALPLTSNGKVDRKRLPVPTESVRDAARVDAPRTEMEDSIIKIWEKLLKHDSVGVTDNFFEIGGHSLLAVRMVDAISRIHDQKLRLVDVFRNPTPQGVARLLDGGDVASVRTTSESGQVDSAPRLRSLEVFVKDGPNTPLIFVGSTRQSRLVTDQLRADRPIYGMNMFGLHEPDTTPKIDIPSMAKTFLSEVRSLQPHGPYCLAGYCQDSIVAYEMAQQLVAEGETVSYLGLLDGVWFLEEHMDRKHQKSRAQRIARNLRKYGPHLLYFKLKRRVQYAIHNVRMKLGNAHKFVRERLGIPLPLELEHRALIASYFQAIAGYQSKPYAGPVDLYVADEWDIPPNCLGHFPNVTLHELEGYHDLMFEGSQLVELGRTIQLHLDRCDADRRGS